ncbi:hypothetical protein SVAN01_04431 [Stagonosporopsis vannaccii]|nr:hypothetical protein SVAN01_04431 [Stagonosporopsis vannaccii]
MAHQFPPQHQSHQTQISPPHQNIGQQRQGPMAQQQMPAMGQPRVTPGQQPSHSSFDPRFALFFFEKPKGVESWEDVQAEQQYIKAEELQGDVKKFQRNKRSVKNVLNEITSSNCRRLINELVEEENHKLFSLNRTLQWNIASVDVEWKVVSHRRRVLKRVSVILQTGPSGYDDPTALKLPAAMATKPQSMPPNQGLPPHPHHPGQEMSQPLRTPPHQNQPLVGHPQQPPPPTRMPLHGHMGGQGHIPAHGGPPGQPHHSQHLPPPPPPPPPSNGMNPPPPPHRPPPFSDGLPPPPPPPPGPLHGMPRPPMPGQQQSRVMPGAFPEPPHHPAARPGQPQGRHAEVSSESEIDSEEWESEPSDSASDRFRIRHVERGEFAHIGKPPRGRSRQSSHSKKSRHSNSHSKGRSNSRSRAYSKTRRRRHDSGYIDHPPMGKYSPTSSKDNSPHSSKQQLPPNIHIHMNNTATDKPTRSNDRVRRDSHGATSPGYKKERFTAEPMSRGDSWDRHSGSASFNDNSSVHTADDSVFSEPDKHGRRSRHHSDIVENSPKLRSRNLQHRQRDFGHRHPSHIHGDVEPRQRRSAYPTPNDYPHGARQRDSYFDDQAYPRPGVPRRNSAQIPQGNPFETAHLPPRLVRANTFEPEMYESAYGRGEPYYPLDRPRQDSFKYEKLFNALDELREQERRPLHGRRTGGFDRMGGYGGFDAYEGRGY